MIQIPELFSPEYRYKIWRKLWLALAEGQQELGYPIRDEQLKELRQAVSSLSTEIDPTPQAHIEEEVHQHLQSLGEQCPVSRPILNWGVPYTFVSDNGLLIQMYQALGILLQKLIHVLRMLTSFAEEYRDLPCLAYTHGKPASLTTMGKRICIWLQDFLTDTQQLEYRLSHFQFLGMGTHYLNANRETAQSLQSKIAKKMGFSHLFPLSGYSYPRKQDLLLVQVLSHIGISARKLANDLRLLTHRQEVFESSPWDYTHSHSPPITEQINAQAHYLISLTANPSHALATSWLDHSSDDTLHQHRTLAAAFLSSDELLDLIHSLVEHIIIQPDRIAQHVKDHVPFLAGETILQKAIDKGGDPSDLQQRLRLYTQTAKQEMQRKGPPNPLIKMVQDDAYFPFSNEEIETLLIPNKYTEHISHEVQTFLDVNVHPLLSKYQALPAMV